MIGAIAALQIAYPDGYRIAKTPAITCSAGQALTAIPPVCGAAGVQAFQPSFQSTVTIYKDAGGTTPGLTFTQFDAGDVAIAVPFNLKDCWDTSTSNPACIFEDADGGLGLTTGSRTAQSSGNITIASGVSDGGPSGGKSGDVTISTGATNTAGVSSGNIIIDNGLSPIATPGYIHLGTTTASGVVIGNASSGSTVQVTNLDAHSATFGGVTFVARGTVAAATSYSFWTASDLNVNKRIRLNQADCSYQTAGAGTAMTIAIRDVTLGLDACTSTVSCTTANTDLNFACGWTPNAGDHFTMRVNGLCDGGTQVQDLTCIVEVLH